MNHLLYPNVSGAPGTSISKDPAQAPDHVRGTEQNGQAAPTESFSRILGNELTRPVVEPLKFSAHATARMQSRKIDMGPEAMRKLNEAVDRAAAKGLDDTLVLTKDAAYIVSVKNRTIVTAMDRSQLEGNVFTNIDGAIVV